MYKAKAFNPKKHFSVTVQESMLVNYVPTYALANAVFLGHRTGANGIGGIFPTGGVVPGGKDGTRMHNHTKAWASTDERGRRQVPAGDEKHAYEIHYHSRKFKEHVGDSAGLSGHNDLLTKLTIPVDAIQAIWMDSYARTAGGENKFNRKLWRANLENEIQLDANASKAQKWLTQLIGWDLDRPYHKPTCVYHREFCMSKRGKAVDSYIPFKWNSEYDPLSTFRHWLSAEALEKAGIKYDLCSDTRCQAPCPVGFKICMAYLGRIIEDESFFHKAASTGTCTVLP